MNNKKSLPYEPIFMHLTLSTLLHTKSMIKAFVPIILCVILSSGLKAQNNKKTWAQGKLSWNDFLEKTDTQEASELKYFLGYTTEKQKMNDTVVVRPVAKGYIDTNLSWVNPKFRNDHYLRYNQVIFDMVELFRRKLQGEIDRAKRFYELESKFNTVFQLFSNEIEKFKKESKSGQDLNSIAAWEQKLSGELNANSEQKLPDFENRNFGYAMHAGFGSGFYSGSLGEHFSPSFNFIYGFDFAYKKSILFVNATLAGNKVKKDYFADKSWSQGQRTNVAILDISYGYAFIDGPKIKISPFAGLGITEFTEKGNGNPDEMERMVDSNLIFGVNTDYKLKTRLKFVPDEMFGIKEKVETSIRTRLYITKASYFEDLTGYTMNLSVGLCGFGNLIRLK